MFRPLLRAGALLAVLPLMTAACAAHTPPLPPAPRAVVVPVEVDALTPDTPPLPVKVVDAPPVPLPLEVVSGEATYYAELFNGRRTASGIVFHNDQPWAAHRTFPFGTVVRVINERNGREVILTVVDRGPHGAVAAARNTIIDVSRSAAEELDFIRAGRTPVRVEVLEWGGGS